MIRVQCSVPIIPEVNKGGKEKEQNILVTNHPIQHKLITLTTPDGQKFDVVANDLITAVQNAVNTHRF